MSYNNEHEQPPVGVPPSLCSNDLNLSREREMSYNNEQQPPVMVPPPQAYPPRDEHPAPGYPPAQGLPQDYLEYSYSLEYAGPFPTYNSPPPENREKSTGCLQGCLAVLCCCCVLDACF